MQGVSTVWPWAAPRKKVAFIPRGPEMRTNMSGGSHACGASIGCAGTCPGGNPSGAGPLVPNGSTDCGAEIGVTGAATAGVVGAVLSGSRPGTGGTADLLDGVGVAGASGLGVAGPVLGTPFGLLGGTARFGIFDW